jgi:hypothetical protein
MGEAAPLLTGVAERSASSTLAPSAPKTGPSRYGWIPAFAYPRPLWSRVILAPRAAHYGGQAVPAPWAYLYGKTVFTPGC